MTTGLVSCYAFLKGWLLLSQPPSCQSHRTSFALSVDLGTLAGGRGLFPFWPVELRPHGLTPVWLRNGIRSLVGCGRLAPSVPIQCSTSVPVQTRLALKLFRGEPAIAKFDWNFSTTHSSSPRVVRRVGSDLHAVLPALHPGHG